VIAASGLSPVIGPSTIKRACQRVGVEPRAMGPAELARALPAVQEAMRIFLGEEEYRRRLPALTSLAQESDPLPPEQPGEHLPRGPAAGGPREDGSAASYPPP
jgi:hypothetical protein